MLYNDVNRIANPNLENMFIGPTFKKSLSRGTIICLGIVSAIGYAGLFMLLPAIPEISAAFQVTMKTTQLTVSLGFIVIGLGQFCFGLLADRYSRYKLLLVAMLLFVISSLVAAWATTIEMLIIGRVMQAATGSGGITVARTMALECGDRDEAATILSYIILPITLVPLIAPPLGGLLTDLLSWRWVLFAGAVLGILGVLLILFFVPNTPPPIADAPRKFLDVMPLFNSRRFKSYCGHHSLVVVAMQVLNTSAPILVISQMGYSAAEYGAFAMIPAFGSICGALAGSKFTKRFGGDKLICYGSVVAVGSYCYILIMTITGQLSPLVIFLPMILIAFSNTMILPSSTAGALEGQRSLGGSGAGLMGMIQWLLAGVVVQIAAFWVESSAVVVIWVAFFCYLAAIGSFLSTIKRRNCGFRK